MPSTDLTVASNPLGLTTRQARKLQRQDAATAIEVHSHRRDVRKLAACVEADIEALSDVNRTAMFEEMDLADAGIARAAGSSLKSRSVARALQRQEALADRIVRRAFGGW
jgi:hypothetical protein